MNKKSFQHFCLMVEILSLHILWWQKHKFGEILMINRKTLCNCVIGNLNSEQLVFGQQ